MRKFLVLPAALVAACVGVSQEEQLLAACEAHDAGVRALAPMVAAGSLRTDQVGAVDYSIGIADQVCDGTVVNYDRALDIIEGEVLRLSILGGE